MSVDHCVMFSNSCTLSIWNRINRWFCKIGYLRAARELERMGHTQIANNLLKQMKSED